MSPSSRRGYASSPLVSLSSLNQLKWLRPAETASRSEKGIPMMGARRFIWCSTSWQRPRTLISVYLSTARQRRGTGLV
ncbi:hypothetical protein ES703_77678 [subsurface metagenome]